MVSELSEPAMENSSSATIGSSSTRSGPVSFTHALSIKLNQDNFLLWSHQVLAAIKGHKLLHFIKSSVKPLQYLSDADKQSGILNPEYLDYEQQDQLLLSWLLSSMSENLLTRMIGCNESHKIWSKLEQYFTVTTKAQVKQLRGDLAAIKKGSKSMNDYLLQIKTTIDLLASIGEEIKEDNHVDAIFEGLGPDYDSFVTSMETRKELYNVAEMESLLLSQERRIAKHHSQLDSTTNQMANLTSTGNSAHNSHNPRPNTTQQNFSGSTRGRGRNGRGRGRGWNSSNRPQCQLCGKLGHLAPQCWHRFDQAFSGVSQSFPQTPGAPTSAGRGVTP